MTWSSTVFSKSYKAGMHDQTELGLDLVSPRWLNSRIQASYLLLGTMLDTQIELTFSLCDYRFDSLPCRFA